MDAAESAEQANGVEQANDVEQAGDQDLVEDLTIAGWSIVADALNRSKAWAILNRSIRELERRYPPGSGARRLS